jgi:hypothetical protein
VRVIACATFPREGASARHDLARAFRDGDEAAFDAVLALVVAVLGRPGGVLGGETAQGSVAAVAVPGHTAGARNLPCERLVAALASRFPALRVAPGALVRVADAPAALGAAERDPAAESSTLAWRPGLVPSAATTLLLVDDVVRSGATLAAAVLAAPPSIAPRIVPVAVFRAEEPPGATGAAGPPTVP